MELSNSSNKYFVVSRATAMRAAVVIAAFVMFGSIGMVFQARADRAEMVEVTKQLIVQNEKLQKQLDEALIPQATVGEAAKAGVQKVWNGIKNLFS